LDARRSGAAGERGLRWGRGGGSGAGDVIRPGVYRAISGEFVTTVSASSAGSASAIARLAVPVSMKIVPPVYGGAVLSLPEAGDYSERKDKNRATKLRIAQQCARLVKLDFFTDAFAAKLMQIAADSMFRHLKTRRQIRTHHPAVFSRADDHAYCCSFMII
jgi:hypothetical protein